MRYVTLLLLLTFSLLGKSSPEPALQQYCNRWSARLKVQTVHPEVKVVRIEQLLDESKHPCFGNSALDRDGVFRIHVLDARDYWMMDLMAEDPDKDHMSRREIKADQRDTVLHELTHLMIALSEFSEEEVVVKLSYWMGRVK